MRKIAIVFVLVLVFFSSAGTSYLYFSEKNNVVSIPVKTTENSNSNDTNLVKNTPPNNQNNINLIDPPDTKTVKDKSLFSKEVFLTFDDGPSANTLKILKILNDNNVKATFFVIGSNVDEYPNLAKAEHLSGMAIINHSYSHEYSIYKSIEAFNMDFNKCNISIKNATGADPLPYLRFPGGSDNTVSNSKTMKSIRSEVISKGIKYVDWNVDSGDADGYRVPASTIDKNLLKQMHSSKFAIALMHDAPVKTTTVDALPALISYLKSQGFVFRTFADLTPTEEKEMIKERIIDREIIIKK